MDKPKTSPKDFFLWAGAMLALYVSVFSFIALAFDYINYAFPDALSYLPQPYSSSMTFEMAALIVLFPLALVLLRFIRRDIVRMPEKKDIWARRWALVFTIFVAAVTVAIDLIVLIQNFLGGNLTTPFLLKILIILLVIGGCFLHFLAELRGYWDTEHKKSTMVAIGASVAVIAIIVGGFFIMGAPWNVRLYRFDDQKISDLQSIEWQILSYWQQKATLPAHLSDLNDSLSNYVVPVDTQTGQSYEYIPVSKYSFQLCATFNAETEIGSPSGGIYNAPMPIGVASGLNPQTENWYHYTGRTCFLRTIDPTRYPPIKTPIN